MPDDRDQYRRKTPPAGVRAQTAPPEGEFDKNELTPVYGTPEVQTLKRAEQAAESGKSAAGTSKQALKIVGELKDAQESLSKQVKDYAETDQRDHKEMKGSIGELKSDMHEVKTDVRTLTTHMSDVREVVGKISGKMEAWGDQVAIEQQNAAHEQRIRFTYKNKVRLKWWDLVVKILAAGGAVLATYEVSKLLGITH